MAQVKVKEKFQVTIPAKIREKLGIEVGDLLEADLEDERIVLKPQVVLDKAKAVEEFFTLLSKNRRVEMSDEEVVRDALAAIKEIRKRKHGKARA